MGTRSITSGELSVVARREGCADAPRAAIETYKAFVLSQENSDTSVDFADS